MLSTYQDAMVHYLSICMELFRAYERPIALTPRVALQQLLQRVCLFSLAASCIVVSLARAHRCGAFSWPAMAVHTREAVTMKQCL